MPKLTQERLMRATLAAALGAGVLAAAAGVGYRSSDAVLNGAAAWLQRKDKVVHVNAESGSADAESARKLATGRQTLEIVQVRPGVIYVVNNQTGEVHRMPTDTMQPQPVRPPQPDAADKVHVVSGGGDAYVVDAAAGEVTQLPEGGNAGRQARVPIPNRVDEMVVDSRGTGWALSIAAGELYVITDAQVRARHRVAAQQETTALSLVADRPVVYQPRSGAVSLYSDAGRVRQVQISAVEADVQLSAPGAPAPVAVAVHRATGDVFAADVDTGKVVRGRLADRAGHEFGRPVVHAGRVYVPDHRTRHIVQLDLASLRVQNVKEVPGESRFVVFARDDRVWVNDPHQATVLVFDSTGRSTEVDTGDDDGEHTQQPTAPQTPPPTKAPPSSKPAPPKQLRVPDVSGMAVGPACERIRAEGFNRCIGTETPDVQGEPGRAVRTQPAAGSLVSASTRVTVFHPGPRTVPGPLVGLSTLDACAALTTAGLRCREKVEGLAKNRDGVRKVTRVEPDSGTRVDSGAEITIVYPAQIEVPNVVGMDVAQADATLESVGLDADPYDPGGPCATPGLVSDQDPDAGTGATAPGPVRFKVRIAVCGTTPRPVPPVVGMTPDQACQAIEAQGLQCERVPDAATRDLNKVLHQEPAANTVVGYGTPVKVVFETTAPLPLRRFKAPGANRANFISPTDPGPDRWSDQSSPGLVYARGEAGVPGLVPVYLYQCDPGHCGEEEVYFLALFNGPRPNWTLQNEAFRCFNRDAAPAGTRPLHRLMNDNLVRVWAVPGTDEYSVFKRAGFDEAPDGNPILCYIW